MNTEDMNNDKKITHTVIHVDPENYRFKTISDFKWAMEYNSEVAFEWNGKDYSITLPIHGWPYWYSASLMSIMS